MKGRRPATSTGSSLFEPATRNLLEDPSSTPLAERVRPRTFSELVGQPKLFGSESPLARAVAADQLRSSILWGPPGSGKTTLARVVAESTKARFVALNAALAGVADVREATAAARETRRIEGRRTILFIDEIHRFNKSQQDGLLPHVEDGTVTLIGATTENPSFSVVAPLLSRCKVYRLEALSEADVIALLERAAADPRGLASRISVEREALVALAGLAQGDARRALASLERAADAVMARGETTLTIQEVSDQSEHKTLLYDKAGEEHYNVISAFIKSMRGSDPDAAIYWLMRMLEAGDDPLFLLRRMMIFASEDIGNADPRALEVAVAADAAFRRLGMPEGMYPIAQAALYLASAPKSNACTTAWKSAQGAVRQRGALPVPMKLRNAVTGLMKSEGYGNDYRYPHSEGEGYAAGETYLPDDLVGERFYEPTTRGFEKTIRDRLAMLRATNNDPERP